VITLADNLYCALCGLYRALIAPAYPKDTHSILKLKDHNDLHSEKRVAYSRPLPINLFHAVKDAQDATINDVFVAVLTSTIRTYLKKHDSSVIENSSLSIHGGN
jgi:hypothetical protein